MVDGVYQNIVDVLKPGCTAADIRRAGKVITDNGYTVVAPLVARVLLLAAFLWRR